MSSSPATSIRSGIRRSRRWNWYSMARLAFMRSLLYLSKGLHPHATSDTGAFDVWSRHPDTSTVRSDTVCIRTTYRWANCRRRGVAEDGCSPSSHRLQPSGRVLGDRVRVGHEAAAAIAAGLGAQACWMAKSLYQRRRWESHSGRGSCWRIRRARTATSAVSTCT